MAAARNAAGTGNGGRQAPLEEHVEFVVKAAEDLILEGTERRLTRVRAGTPYSCLMLKQQRFSSLFRHYAKHHGLKKDELAYYFTEELQNEDTPESVFLQARDEIIVRKRRPGREGEDDDDKVDLDALLPNEVFMGHIAALLREDSHCDVTFYCGPDGETVGAHKAILVARSEYFHGMFRKGAMREGQTCKVTVEGHDAPSMRKMLEFIYTNRVAGLDTDSAKERCNADDLTRLLSLAEEYLLRDLKLLVEHAARAAIDANNVAKLLDAAEQFHADVLKQACMDFIQKYLSDVSHNPNFEQHVCSSPALGIAIMKALAEKNEVNAIGKDPDDKAGKRGLKRRRVDNEVEPS